MAGKAVVLGLNTGGVHTADMEVSACLVTSGMAMFGLVLKLGIIGYSDFGAGKMGGLKSQIPAVVASPQEFIEAE